MSEDTVKVGPWTWTKWPTLPLPTEDWLVAQAKFRGAHAPDEFHRQYELNIKKEQVDPLQYGWEQPPLKVARSLLAGTYEPGKFGIRVAPREWKQLKPCNDLAFLGGNGSGKTELLAKLGMETLELKPGSEARCFSQNETTSVRFVQRAMFRYLRPEYRKIKSQGLTTKISYKEATGFSEGLFILPSHSACLFPTYKGYEQDKKSVEGGECDILTWDEEAPAEMLETARFRVHKKGGTVLGGFTPVLGYTETVGEYVEGAVVLEVIPARRVVWDWWKRSWSWGEWILPADKELVRGCPRGHIPFVLQSGQGGGRRFAMVFPTMFNPYTNVEAIIESTADKPIDFALRRLWGWSTKQASKAFPNFSPHHIVPANKVPTMSEVSLYHFADPHGQRNWFMLWIGIDHEDRVWVLREWPDAQIGEWALPGPKADGRPGPAQNDCGGKSFNDYKRLVLSIEGWKIGEQFVWEKKEGAWEPCDRRMDPRPAGTSVPSDEEARTYLDHMADPIRSESGQILVPGLDYVAAPVCGIEEGVQLINDWLTRGWNQNEPVDPLNCPRFYISEQCVNTIWALRTYTGADGEKGACKDPIDCLKGAAKLGLRHLAKGALGSYGGWGGY